VPCKKKQITIATLIKYLRKNIYQFDIEVNETQTTIFKLN